MGDACVAVQVVIEEAEGGKVGEVVEEVDVK